MRTALALGLVFSLSVAPYRYPNGSAPVAGLNANTTPAGTLRNGVLTLALEAKLAMWYPEGTAKPGRKVAALGEGSRPALVPGPLIRVAAGTIVRLSIRNSLDGDTIAFHIPASVHGGPTADVVDSVVVAPGARGEMTFTAAVPGNYFYRARTNSRLDRLLEIGGAMAGGIVVDSTGEPPPHDRVMVLLASTDSAAPSGVPDGDSIIFSINGRSWPNTERVSATVGDTLHWRVINATNDFHPMHLHGFYYRVDTYTYQGSPRFAPPLVSNLMVVTQRLVPFSAMSLTWSPERPGNWLFHCHFQVHVARPNESGNTQAAHGNHALTGMQGLVMGIIVAPRPGTRAVSSTPTLPARQLRLVAVQDSAFPDSAPSMRFLVQEPARSDTAVGAGPGFSPPIIIERGKPVAITVVNHLKEPTAVHWHGMELDSYNDGAPGFSGIGTRVSPLIAPQDSFVARFTPPRSGTFIYHSHSNEPTQHRAGMLGALIVVDSLGPSPYDDHTFFLKSARSGADAVPVMDIDGTSNPDTVVLHAGRPARLRFISLALLNPNANVIVTARPDSVRVLLRDSLTVNWLPLAKDGADLPLPMRTPRLARQVIGMGETYDFEFTPTAPGILRMEVRGAGAGGLLGRVPIRVELRN